MSRTEVLEKKGGPAFPTPLSRDACGRMVSPLQYDLGGLTARDYFAAHAPDVPDFFPSQSTLRVVDIGNGMVGPRDIKETAMERFIRWKFVYADAMLAERTK